MTSLVLVGREAFWFDIPRIMFVEKRIEELEEQEALAIAEADVTLPPAALPQRRHTAGVISPRLGSPAFWGSKGFRSCSSSGDGRSGGRISGGGRGAGGGGWGVGVRQCGARVEAVGGGRVQEEEEEGGEEGEEEGEKGAGVRARGGMPRDAVRLLVAEAAVTAMKVELEEVKAHGVERKRGLYGKKQQRGKVGGWWMEGSFAWGERSLWP
eukprot:jgi/Undpi1/10683/HiC_scaffold_29.g13131.m1